MCKATLTADQGEFTLLKLRDDHQGRDWHYGQRSAVLNTYQEKLLTPVPAISGQGGNVSERATGRGYLLAAYRVRFLAAPSKPKHAPPKAKVSSSVLQPATVLCWLGTPG